MSIQSKNRQIILQQYARAQQLKKEALLEEAFDGVINEFKSYFVPQKPLASVLKFIMNGMLWQVSKRWFLANELLKAVGLDLEQYLANFVNELATHATQKTLTRETADQLVDQWSDKLESHVSKIPSSQMLSAIQQQPELMRGAEALGYKQVGAVNNSHQFIKQAQGKVGLFRRILGFLAGLAVPVLVTGAAKGALNIHPKTPSENASATNLSEAPKNIPYITISPAENIDTEFTERHANYKTYYWTEKFDPSQLKNELVRWTLGVYPKMEKFKTNIIQSTAFNTTLNYILKHNEGNRGFTIIPRPYLSKMDVVNTFIQDVVNQIKTKLKKKKP